jgi:hypothetical protein
MWKNIVEPDRPQKAIQRMHITCWISKAIDIHSEYVILLVFPRQTGYANALQCYVMRAFPVLS